MGELSKLPNIGKAVEEQLNKVGIDTSEKLRELGAERAWLEIQKIDESACIHRLLALEGAICGVKKTLLSDERKAELKEFYNKNKINKKEVGERIQKIRFSNLTTQYKECLIFIVQEMLQQSSDSAIRKIVKMIERGA